MSELPYVVCVCIAGKTPWHDRFMLPRAIDAFQNQTYPANRRILAVVSDVAIDGLDWHVQCPKGTSLGAMRNIALNELSEEGDLILQWDSDDWMHPQRIEHQVAVWEQEPVGAPVFLRRQLCYSFDTDVAYVREFPHVPILGTILHRNESDKRYPDIRQHEDTAFAQLWKPQDWKIIANDPKLYIRFSHAASTSGYINVMREAADWPDGTWHMHNGDFEHLKSVLDLYKGIPSAPKATDGIPQLVAV